MVCSRFDAQPVQRYETFQLVLLSDTECFIVGFSVHIRQLRLSVFAKFRLFDSN